MKERIQQIMQGQQMMQQEFAAAIGISQSSLSNILKGRTSATTNTVHAIHRRFPEINIEWLMFGEGEMLQAQGATTTPAQLPDIADDGVHPMGDSFSPVPENDKLKEPQVVREIVKFVDKPQRNITEIRVFYDDGTFDTFFGRRE